MKREAGTVVNIDGDLFYWIYKSCGGDVTDVEETLASYVRGYADKGISDLLFCCFCQNSLFPTKVLSWRGDKLTQKEENRGAVDYSETPQVRAVTDIYGAMTQDPIAFLLEETRRNGMNAWLSMRMNDAHFNHQPTCWIHGDIYYEAKEKGMMIGDVTGRYYEECLDYGAAYVREKMVAYLCECVDKYDVDGLELDFMREIFCFDYKKNPDCHIIMTEFMARVRACVRAKEKERGYRIRLAVRLCRAIEDNKIFGFDAAEWVRRGLWTSSSRRPVGRARTAICPLPIGKRWRRVLTSRYGRGLKRI